MMVAWPAKKKQASSTTAFEALNTVSFRMDPSSKAPKRAKHVQQHQGSKAACRRIPSAAAVAAALALPFAGLFGVAALLHSFKGKLPLLFNEVLPPAVDAQSTIASAGHVEAHFINSSLLVAVCLAASFQAQHQHCHREQGQRRHCAMESDGLWELEAEWASNDSGHDSIRSMA